MIRSYESGRLAYYGQQSSADFWDQHWDATASHAFYAGAERGEFGPLEGAFTRHLPRKGRILEAGCGLGQIVLALRQRGYNAEGMEFAPRTVSAVLSRYPDLPVRPGDVCRIDCSDGAYDAYISLGVIEHRQAGPEPFLREAHRVLASHGRAFVSVPFLHSLRKIKARLGFYRGTPINTDFYQYAFDKAEMIATLRQSGFKVIETIMYDGCKGLADELAVVRLALKIPVVGGRIRAWLAACQWVENHFGHMMLYVCEKVSRTESQIDE